MDSIELCTGRCPILNGTNAKADARLIQDIMNATPLAHECAKSPEAGKSTVWIGNELDNQIQSN
jgi:hypothetical protein